MKKLFLLGFLMVSALLPGCEAAFERRLKSDTCDKYAIEAIATTFTTADNNFDDKVRELCPKGYKVLKRHYDNGEVKGWVECECQAGKGTDKSRADAVTDGEDN
jgi:hypothetical protein